MTSLRARLSWRMALALGALSAALACKKAPPAAPTAPPGQTAAAVRVTEVQIGNELGQDKRVKAPKSEFSSKDVIFASVVTEGSAPSAELTARWTFQDGQVVNETKRSIAPSAPSDVTEFSIQKPDGWPVGTYQVHISLNGQPAETKSFRVQ
jgi:hypothetical protein